MAKIKRAARSLAVVFIWFEFGEKNVGVNYFVSQTSMQK